MDEVVKLRTQLKVARDEISNLRSQVNSLNHVQRKDIEAIRQTLKDFKCSHCSSLSSSQNQNDEALKNNQSKDDEVVEAKTEVVFKPIGVIRTIFTEKRAVPRQANIAETILSRIELSKDLYTNPEQCIETLDSFSHFWIIYHFHRNDPHSKPKISPPRLDGKKVGVFATRSPHRPNPIGMSLVKLDRIEGSTIYFYGSDMVDETPVFDIKPYIPSYDSPQKNVAVNSNPSDVSLRSREEPEGEEDDSPVAQPALPNVEPEEAVKVPDWVSSTRMLTVIFSENALSQIQELGVSQQSIQEILQNDPRSVYVREKYLSQIYNFQLSGNNVMCKFDDKHGTVSVLQIRRIVCMNE